MSLELENRKCVLTGSVGEKDDLLRFVLLKDGTMLPDFDKKLLGRGFYISNSKKLLENLVLQNQGSAKSPLNKILHTKVIIADNLPEIVENILEKKALNSINLARKSGTLVTGLEKIKELVGRKQAAFTVIASDAGNDGRKKIEQISKDIPKINTFTIRTLSTTLNKENSVYLAVVKGKMEKMVYQALNKYTTYLNA